MSSYLKACNIRKFHHTHSELHSFVSGETYHARFQQTKKANVFQKLVEFNPLVIPIADIKQQANERKHRRSQGGGERGRTPQFSECAFQN